MAAGIECVERAMTAGRTLLLADIRSAESGPGPEHLAELAQALLDSGIGPRLREAVMYDAGTASEFGARLWENACVERGLRVRAFGSREAALAWLLVT